MTAQEAQLVVHDKIQSSFVFLLFVCVGSFAAAQAPQNVPASGEERSTIEINVLNDCGARGDGTSDDASALQKCIDTHPGKTIVFPRTRNKGVCDYELSQTLSVNANSTALVGVGGTANNNTTLCWSADVTGIRLSGVAGDAVRNLNLRGNSPFNPADTGTYTTGMSDGLRVSAGQASVRDVFVLYFSRHGVNVDSTQGGQADIWIFDNVRSEHNRGDGFHFIGLDANGGLCLMCIARLNQGWGFFNHAVIPSTYVAPLTDSNHNDPTASKQTVQIERITVANKVATVTTMTPHQTIAGDWGVFIGCPNFPIKAAVVAVPDPTTLQIATSNADGVYCDTHSATYSFKAGARIWAMGRTVNDAAIKARSNYLTSALAHWTPNDYGTLVCIEQAGPNGKEFCSTVKFISGNTATLADSANSDVQEGRARIVTNGGPYNAGNSTFVQSYTEGNQEGDSQLIGSLTLGADWGIGTNPEIDSFILADGYASPLKFVRRNAIGGYGHSVFQAGRAFGMGSISRDPSYEGFWNSQEIDDHGRILSTLSFRHSNVTGATASGWNCFSDDPHLDGTALAASSMCWPDVQTRVSMNGRPTQTHLPMFPAGGFWVKGSGVQDAATSTSGLRQIRYDASEAPKSCNAGDIFYKASPVSGSYIGWVCTAADSPLPFGGIGSSRESVLGERVSTPKSANADCNIGQWAADTAYYYVCTERNVWRRAALNSW
jgi:hypothetical protein